MKSMDEVKEAFEIADNQIRTTGLYNATIHEELNSPNFAFYELEFEKLKKHGIEYILTNGKAGEKEYVNLFASIYSRVPMESLHAAQTKKGQSLLNALLLRGQQQIRPDILNSLIDQCNYRIANVEGKLPGVAREIKAGMVGAISSALENGIDIKTDDIKKAYDTGLITYENLREMAQKGVLTKEILEMPIQSKIMHFNFTEGKREMKESVMPLHQFLLHDGISVQKDSKSVGIVEHLEKTFPQSDIPFKEILFSYELEKQAYHTLVTQSVISDFALIDAPLKYQHRTYKELLNVVNKNNYEAIGKSIAAMISGRTPSLEAADIMCDLLAAYHRYNKDPNTKELANYINHIHQQCLVALNTGKEISTEEQERANATLEKALKFCENNKLTTKIAIEELQKAPKANKAPKVKKGNEFTISGPQTTKDELDAKGEKWGAEKITKNDMFAALLKLPCDKADKHFDDLKYLVPEQKQFRGNVVARIFDRLAELFCRSSVKSKHAQRFRDHMATPEVPEVASTPQQATQVDAPQGPELQKPTEAPPLPPSHKPPLPPSHKPPLPPSHKPPIPGMAFEDAVKTSASTTNPAIKEDLPPIPGMAFEDAVKTSASTTNPAIKEDLQTSMEALANQAAVEVRERGSAMGK